MESTCAAQEVVEVLADRGMRLVPGMSGIQVSICSPLGFGSTSLGLRHDGASLATADTWSLWCAGTVEDVVSLAENLARDVATDPRTLALSAPDGVPLHLEDALTHSAGLREPTLGPAFVMDRTRGGPLAAFKRESYPFCFSEASAWLLLREEGWVTAPASEHLPTACYLDVQGPKALALLHDRIPDLRPPVVRSLARVGNAASMARAGYRMLMALESPVNAVDHALDAIFSMQRDREHWDGTLGYRCQARGGLLAQLRSHGFGVLPSPDAVASVGLNGAAWCLIDPACHLVAAVVTPDLPRSRFESRSRREALTNLTYELIPNG